MKNPGGLRFLEPEKLIGSELWCTMYVVNFYNGENLKKKETSAI